MMGPLLVLLEKSAYQKPGLWLISGQITITNDFNANGSYIDVFMSLDGKEYNAGTFNTYDHNNNVMFVHVKPYFKKYVDAPGKEVSEYLG